MKTNLGGRVFAEFSEEGRLVLTTETPHGSDNVIVLEPAVYGALVAFVDDYHPGKAMADKAFADGLPGVVQGVIEEMAQGGRKAVAREPADGVFAGDFYAGEDECDE
jgi:hypothetical protein